LNKEFNKKLFLLKKKKLNYNNSLRIKFTFVSLISPFLINNLRFNFNLLTKEKKIMLKQSYILLTWFYYISFINQKKNKKNKVKFFVFPVFNEKFTTTKAPMAHKNWSKEQYKFSFYKFVINFNCHLKEENKVNSLNEFLLFILLTKKNFPFFETNLFFLKNINFFFKFKDQIYFNYYNFLTNNKKKF
jgi:hypothetical protein